jgi:mycothiol S-conjugate amidase
MLGYRDSGMPGTPENEDPRSFASAELDEAIGRLVAIIRRERPQVLITYGDEQDGYPHPDHLRVHDISLPAFEAAGDPDAYPAAGPPWQPSKLYYTVWSKKRFLALHETFKRLGLETPWDEKWLKRPGQDHKITTHVDVTGYAEARQAALLAHATQIDPASPFWFGLPPEVAQELNSTEEYVLARSLVDSELPEDDLFAGLRDSVDATAR